MGFRIPESPTSHGSLLMNQHQEQVGSTLRRAIQDVLSRGLQDPRVQGLISVTSVQLSADQSEATVKVSVMPEDRADLTLHGLRHAARHLQSQVAKRVKMRRVPRLSFRLDQSIKKEAAIHAAISSIRREREPENAESTQEDERP